MITKVWCSSLRHKWIGVVVGFVAISASEVSAQKPDSHSVRIYDIEVIAELGEKWLQEKGLYKNYDQIRRDFKIPFSDVYNADSTCKRIFA